MAGAPAPLRLWSGIKLPLCALQGAVRALALSMQEQSFMARMACTPSLGMSARGRSP